MNKLWKEYSSFRSKTGVFGRPYMWNSEDARKGNSAQWHIENSIGFATVFGLVTAHTTSKITGIGQAERTWKDVKTIKSGQ